MAGQPGKVILIRRTITIVQAVPVITYLGDTPEQARDYELSMPLEDKIGAFVEAIEMSDDIDFSEAVTIQDAPAPVNIPNIPRIP